MDSILLMFLSVIVGGCLVGMAIWSRDLAKTRGREFRWWYWLLVAIWAFTWLLAFAWLGTSLGEGGIVKSAWMGFGFIIGFNIILAAVILQLIVRQKPGS